ncbi:MAG: hypothetical protein A2V70_00155 [Planctomycetes bacterium RBG_13_63_9]|nr:MAG: hypothetical protein A2V70_00155 [Planctomycetes bacterium RBG_13_63_9]
MSEKAHWREELLASGLPLESDAARLLVSKGFRVVSDFKFTRAESGVVRDCFVQLLAGTSLGPSDPDQPTGSLELVFECRHRSSGAAWLYLSDPNPREKSPITPGHTVRVVDTFSSFAVDGDATVAFDRQLPACYKGVEIDVERGSVADVEPSGGLAQLQYALPRVVVEIISRNLTGPPGRNVPFLFCPVLLTTARLLVADEGLSVERVKRASELLELAHEVPYLTVYSDYGPDFQSHCQREFGALEALERGDDTLIVERRRAAHYRSDTELPIAVIESLMAADRHWLHRLFTQFVVCSEPQLPALLDAIQQVAASAIQSRKEV